MNVESMNKTDQCIYGHWYWEKEENGIKMRIEVSITRPNGNYLEYKEYKNDDLILEYAYSPLNAWFGDKLSLVGDKCFFYVTYANETEMHFGSFQSEIEEDTKWHRKFIRKVENQ